MKSPRKQTLQALRKAVSACTLISFLLSCGCSRNAPKPLESIADAYVRVALELGERDPDSLDFAVVPTSIRDEVHRTYPSLDAIDHETSQLLSQLQTPAASNEQQLRAQFLTYQLQAIHMRIAMLKGRNLDFDSEARALFQTERLPDTSMQQRVATRSSISALLPSQHGSSRRTPAAAYAEYDKRFLIPTDRLPAVMHAALANCRQQTLSYIILPHGESADLTFVRNQPWSAFSRFHGNAHSTISINMDFPITVDEALELACHEGYPGHHVFNTLRDIALAQKRHWPEAQVQLTFSPQSYLSESAAAYAPRLAFTVEERARVERDLLFPLAGLPPGEAERYTAICSLVRELDTAQPRIAQQYLDGQLEFVRAANQLQAELLMQHSEATLLYLNEYRSYMLAYTDGPRRIAALLEQPSLEDLTRDSRISEHRREAWKRYAQLIESMALPLTEASQRGDNH